MICSWLQGLFQKSLSFIVAVGKVCKVHDTLNIMHLEKVALYATCFLHYPTCLLVLAALILLCFDGLLSLPILPFSVAVLPSSVSFALPFPALSILFFQPFIDLILSQCFF